MIGAPSMRRDQAARHLLRRTGARHGDQASRRRGTERRGHPRFAQPLPRRRLGPADLRRAGGRALPVRPRPGVDRLCDGQATQRWM
jgi:hypothetical protein